MYHEGKDIRISSTTSAPSTVLTESDKFTKTFERSKPKATCTKAKFKCRVAEKWFPMIGKRLTQRSVIEAVEGAHH